MPATPLSRRLTAECVGTFFLVLTIGLTVLVGTDLAPVAIAATLTAMIYAGGHVSQAHYNPAITLAFWLRGTFPAREIGPYAGAQVAGAVLASLAVRGVTDRFLVVSPGVGTGLGSFALLELLFTFALALVILNVATAPTLRGNDHYGIAIGLVVLGGAYAAGPISGGAFNPAVALGPALVALALGHEGALSGLWVYLAATSVGAALAVPVYFAMNGRDAPEASGGRGDAA